VHERTRLSSWLVSFAEGIVAVAAVLDLVAGVERHRKPL
jgi:hypothetical protein